MKSYKILWYEDVDKEGEELKDYLESIPNSTIKGKDVFGYWDIECWDTFKAQNLEDVKRIVKEDYYALEVFTVLDDEDNNVLTEEEI